MGLRNPCVQLDRFADGLMQATLDRADGELVRKAGVMGMVLVGRDVRPGDPVRVELPPGEHLALRPALSTEAPNQPTSICGRCDATSA